MLSKRSTVHLLVLALFTLSACLAPPTSSTPTPADPPTATPTPPLTVDDKCIQAENDIYISGDYCFAHPFGYSTSHQVAQGNIPDAVVLTKNMSDNSNAAVNACPYPTTLKLYSQTAEGNQGLNDFVAQKFKIETLSPWSISNKRAFIVKDHQGSTVIYYIYVKHKQNFYTLEFSAGIPDTSISGQSPCADQLEKLLFTVTETFTFLK